MRCGAMDARLPPPSTGTQDALPRWRLQRRCALTPRQLLLSYGVLAALSMAIALPFGWTGLWFIPLWCLVEITVAGALYLCYMAHASDGEQISLSPDGTLAIEVVRGFSTTRYCMNAHWARLERGGDSAGADKQRLWLCSHPLRIEVATQLAPVERLRVERELRRALAIRQAGGAARPGV